MIPIGGDLDHRTGQITVGTVTAFCVIEVTFIVGMKIKIECVENDLNVDVFT